MTTPLLSFVIAAYNAGATLQRTLGSLATDVDRSDVEVLIIDDGSTDDTARIADSFCGMNANFRLLRQANAGPGAARNSGIVSARSDYVAFCDADDIFLPANHLKLTKQMNEASANIGVGTGFSLIENRSIEDFWDNALVRKLKQLGGGEAQRHLKFLVQPNAAPKVFHRAFLMDRDIRFTVGRQFEDVEFTSCALIKSDRILFSELPLFIYDVKRIGARSTEVSARRFEIFDNLEPIIEAANEGDLSGAQSLCLLTGLMRTVLWCMDNVPVDMIDAFNLRLLQTVVRFKLPVSAIDLHAVDPMIQDSWDRRAFEVVKAIWLSNRDGPQLMQLLRGTRDRNAAPKAQFASA